MKTFLVITVALSLEAGQAAPQSLLLCTSGLQMIRNGFQRRLVEVAILFSSY